MPHRILVVDDEPTLVRLMQFILAKQGHTMLSATNGEDALAIIRDERPDLVLLDVMMPRVDGYEVARRVRTHADPALAATPIVMLSAKAQDQDVRRGLEMGVNEFITKPFAPEQLVATVNSYLVKPEAEKDQRAA